MRRLSALLLSIVAACLLPAVSAAGQPDARVVDVVEVFGVLDPPLANYVVERIEDANRRNAELVVLELDTPGGLDVSASAIVRRIVSSRVPIAVWVGPRRARARSAGALLLAAAHVAAMGPSARLGPVHPANLSIDPGSPAGRRLRDQERTLAGTLAAERGRGDPGAFFDATLSASRSRDQRAVDLVVPSVAELLQKSDGRTVETARGAVTLRIRSDEVVVRFHKPGPVRGLLHALASPSLAYAMLLVGAMLLAFELFQPGFGVAGVSSGVLLAGAVYGLTVLPVGVVGAVIAGAGLALLALDVAVHGLGLPTVAGTGMLAYGSLAMFPAPAGALGLPGWLAGLGTVAALVFFVPVMTLVRRARDEPSQQRLARTLVGQTGQVRSVLNPEGFVWVADALWRARSEDGARIPAGEGVRVVRAEGVLLMVRRP